MKQNYSALDKQFSFLVLDYNRPTESELCLQSIRNMVKFDNYEVVFTRMEEAKIMFMIFINEG